MAVHAATFYNTVLMTNAGLDPAALPSTIDEFDAVARAIAGLGEDDQETRSGVWSRRPTALNCPPTFSISGCSTSVATFLTIPAL
ncbi:MAG: hypothetical protein R2839_00885 [Thermomicrobiales bacterium]